MQVFPSREEFIRLSQDGNVIPVRADLLADLETPVSAYAKLRGAGPAFLLESVEGGETVSRYSFIGCDPRKIFRAQPGDTDPLIARSQWHRFFDTINIFVAEVANGAAGKRR